MCNNVSVEGKRNLLKNELFKLDAFKRYLCELEFFTNAVGAMGTDGNEEFGEEMLSMGRDPCFLGVESVEGDTSPDDSDSDVGS